MSRYYSTLKICCAAVLTLGLLRAAAAAGSTTMTPTPQEMCEDDGGRWNADMTCTSAAELAAEQQHMAVSDAVDAAMAAVAGLSATCPPDAEVAAASETAIAAARTALTGADLLSTSQAFALDARLSTIEGNLATAMTAIDEHRHMVAVDQQHMMVSGAIDAAMAAVDGLSDHVHRRGSDRGGGCDHGGEDCSDRSGLAVGEPGACP